MNHNFFSRSPVVKEERSTVMRWVESADPLRRSLMHFERELVTLQETAAKVAFRHGGIVLKEGVSTNDYYGYLTSIDAAVAEATGACRRFQVTVQSSLEVLVTASVFHKPAFRDPHAVGEYAQFQYLECPREWAFYDEEIASASERISTMEERMKLNERTPWLRERVILERAVWSSHRTPEENAAAIAEFRKTKEVELRSGVLAA